MDKNLRYEQKYSVLVGGGENHRMGLYDAALVKENHIASAGSIENAVNSLKSKGIQSIEVEVESLHQLEEALNSGATIAMLDNFDNDSLKKAAEIAKGKIKLEVSGNINLSQINNLKELNIEDKLRPEQISVEEFCKLANLIYNFKK